MALSLAELIAPLRSARIALDDPPTSSSLADVKRVCSLLLSTAARDPIPQVKPSVTGRQLSIR
jgi:hypothetical protein